MKTVWYETHLFVRLFVCLYVCLSFYLCPQVTYVNKDNQTYFLLFDGAVLITKLAQLVHVYWVSL